MVQAITVNGQGKELRHSRPCFGFMAYINQWNEHYVNGLGHVVDEDDEDFDWEDAECVYGANPDFESDNIHFLIWLPVPRCNSDAVKGMIEADLVEIMEAFPQFYSNVTVENLDKVSENSGNWGNANVRITWPLCGQQMQVTIVGAMMLRNLIEYTACNRLYELLRNKGYSPKEAFIYSMMFNGNANWEGEVRYWYQCSDDSALFQDDTEIHDIIMIMEGRLGHAWQGEWGSTASGYGRDGMMETTYDGDGESAPIFERIGHEADLKDILMDVQGAPSDSPTSQTLESLIRNNSSSYHQIDEEELLNCIALINEHVKGN